MRVTFRMLFMVLALLSTNGCRSNSPPSQVASLRASPSSTSPAGDIFPSFYWNIPSGAPTIGDRGSNSIRVAIFGLCVPHPGFYILPRGATVSDVADSAVLWQSGAQEFIGWKHYCGIARSNPDGSYFKIKFPSRPEALRMQLQEGDQIYFSHEVY
jgi:hypothetical protein